MPIPSRRGSAIILAKLIGNENKVSTKTTLKVASNKGARSAKTNFSFLVNTYDIKKIIHKAVVMA